jgi:hypothetical protein
LYIFIPTHKMLINITSESVVDKTLK